MLGDMNILRMIVWTASGALLLCLLMWIDTLFTKYKDMEEIKRGNVAVSTRFIMKLLAQGYILSQSLSISNDLIQGLLVSVVSFVLLFVLEKIVQFGVYQIAGLDLNKGTREGKVAHALFSGSLHITGAFIIAACLL
ncbi:MULTISPECIES: DUF350 domain-containing protein [Brevibacillus]|uniref:DUF350 domain-containing protein n=1 Tax=Brevibacillus TaxID=55080 RepID=UPI000B9AF84A|nr:MULTISPECIES: DUF350 domain-containing protein [Brevibacillus]RFB31644.1 DUF350 domain-containing protein [Brevibacillus sp. VP]